MKKWLRAVLLISLSFSSSSTFASTLYSDTTSTQYYSFSSGGSGTEFTSTVSGVPSELTVYLSHSTSSGSVYFTVNEQNYPYSQVYATESNAINIISN